ncbi:glycosyltransferase family 2 protein [bacterium]|nr:glycosyltransferase family 2 protein [bacterium]
MKNYTSSKLFMTLDAGSMMTKDAIENAVRYFRNRQVKALAANVKIIPDISFWGLTQQIEYVMGHHYKKALTVGNIEYIVGGVGSVFRASILKKVGYYDTNTITEDIDLTMKIVRLGNKKNRVIYAEDVVAYTEGVMSGYALFIQRFRWKLGRFQTFWKNKELFFNPSKKYTAFLTFMYLPFQLFSEFAFLLDPLFIGYVIYLTLQSGTLSTYLSILVFVMFFTVLAIALDRESSAQQRILLLLLSPFAYFMFIAISVVEYSGLIKCLTRWKDVIYADRLERCSWVPVARKGAITKVG